MSVRGIRNAALAAVLLALGAMVTLNAESPLPGAVAEPSTSTPTTTTTTTSSSATTSATTSATADATEFASDDHGYLSSEARCDDGQTLMILGRTARSLVAICVGPDGQLEYRGVRLSDQAGITMAASRGSNDTVIATNDNVTYSISPEAFLVSEGDTVIYRDTWADYHQPRFPAAGTTAASTTSEAPTTSSSPTTTSPTVSTTTVTLPPTTSTEG